MPRLKSTSGLLLAAVLASGVVTYVAAYFLLVDRGGSIGATSGGITETTYLPDYAWGGSTADYLFTPIHWCDKQIRPAYWHVVDRNSYYRISPTL